MASISKQSKETQDRHRKMLAELLKRPENHECMDCRGRNPTWASTNLGVFVCIRCSGLHRQVGVHISKVKSCTMDLWEPEQIAFMQSMGNGRGKAIYEALLPPDYGKPAEGEDSQLVLQWIRTKYEKRRYFSLSAAQQPAPNSAGAVSSGADCDVMALPRAKPRKPKEKREKPTPNQDSPACSPATPQPESPVNYTFDQFMSPSVQSPRQQDSPAGFGGGDGTSAFAFLNSGGDGQSSPRGDAPLTQADTTQNFVDVEAAAKIDGPPTPSAFGFVHTASSVSTSDAPAIDGLAIGQHPANGSAFSFIASAPANSDTQPLAKVPVDHDDESSLLVFHRKPGSGPPLIHGHFASPTAPPERGYVFDPFDGSGPPPTGSGSTASSAASAPSGTAAAAPQVGNADAPVSSTVTSTLASPTDPHSLLLAMQRQMADLQRQLAASQGTPATR